MIESLVLKILISVFLGIPAILSLLSLSLMMLDEIKIHYESYRGNKDHEDWLNEEVVVYFPNEDFIEVDKRSKFREICNSEDYEIIGIL